MSWWDRLLGREQRSVNHGGGATITAAASAEDWYAFLGMLDKAALLPPVSLEAALQVPAFAAAVAFQSRSLASLPLHVFKGAGTSAVKDDGELAMLLNEAPNAEWASFAFRQYFWQQVFTGGRGLAWIERSGAKVLGLWPMDPALTTVVRSGGRKLYRFEGREYPAGDVIDVPFMLRSDQIRVWAPLFLAKRALQLAIAMGDFAAGFFAGGGVPPLALEGPVPSGAEAFKRAAADITRAINLAKESGSTFFPMPPGHTLKPVGFDPAKGQMTEARLFQIQEVARVFGLPPVFVGDLSKGTFSNTEQQDLQLVKHLIGQWAKALEDELNLKLFGQRRRNRYVRHNLDGLQRGDFKSRTEGLALAIQTAQLTPNEARGLEERTPLEHGDVLLVQGATVPLGSEPPKPPLAQPDNSNDTKEPADAGTED